MLDNDTIAQLRAQSADIEAWLDAEAPYTQVDQKHLDADTPERAYWHLGYQIALRDVLTLVEAACPGNKPGKSN